MLEMKEFFWPNLPPVPVPEMLQLYGAEFCEWILGARANGSGGSANDDGSSVIEDILGGQI